MTLTRLSTTLACLAALALPASAQDEGPTAEELLAGLDEALAEADVLRVEFSSSTTGGPGGMDMEGEMIIGREGRFRMTFSGGGGPNVGDFSMLVISDGEQRKMIMDMGGGADSEVEEVSDEDRLMIRLMRTSLARAGASLLFSMGRPASDDVDDMFPIQQPERLEDAELDGETVYVVRYLLSLEGAGPGGPGESLDVTVWLDTESGMPIKRNLTGKSPDGEVLITETYSAFELDPELPDDVFDLGGE
jgi:outer membrane lipoprotein-sorting protein